MKTTKILSMIALAATLVGCWEHEDKPKKDEQKVELELDCNSTRNKEENQECIDKELSRRTVNTNGTAKHF
jgi:Flp pilus assembly protein TadD